MYKFEHSPLKQGERSPLTLIFVFILFYFIGQIIGSVIGAAVFMSQFSGGMNEIESFFNNVQDYPQYRIALTINQAIASFTTFIIAPYILLRFIARKEIGDLKREGVKIKPLWFLFIGITLILSTPFMSYLVTVNRELNFGEWAKNAAEQAQVMTNYMTDFDSIPHFILGLVVMAVLPAIGEEFAFRGILQNLIFKSSKNIHTSVWIAAIIFSAVHLQFDGFFVRVLLAVSFGYIYYWTGSLWYPIIGHFVNNALALTAMYLAKENIIEGDPESFGSMGIETALISLAITIGLHYVIFKNRHKFNKHSVL